MNVRVCGPNLRDQSKGSFHVHREGCADLVSYYGPGRREGGDVRGPEEMLVEDATVIKVVLATYADQVRESQDADLESYIQDFWFAPCCGRIEMGVAPGGDSQEDAANAQESWRDEPAPDPEPLEEVQVVFECWVRKGTFVKFQSLTEVQSWILEALPTLGVHDHLNVVPHRADEYAQPGAEMPRGGDPYLNDDVDPLGWGE